MFRRGQQLKVFKGVIALVAVKMVNVFRRLEGSTDCLLNNPSVLQHPLSGLLILDFPVARVFSLPPRTYRQKTKLSRSLKGGTKLFRGWCFVSWQALVVAFVLTLCVVPRQYGLTATATTDFDDDLHSFFHGQSLPQRTGEHNAF